MAAQEYYTGTPPSTHLPKIFSNPQATQSQPHLVPNNIPPRRGSSIPPPRTFNSMAYAQQQPPRPGRASFGPADSQHPQFPRPPQYAPSPQQYFQQQQPQPQPQQQQYLPSRPSLQVPRPSSNLGLAPVYRPQRPPRGDSESVISSSDSEYSDPDDHHKHSHHHHRHSSSRPRTADRKLSKSPRPHYRSARHNSDAWIGGISGGLIGDLLFPGLGTVGGALAGALQGHHYDVMREAKEDRMEMVRKEKKWKASDEGASRGRKRY